MSDDFPADAPQSAVEMQNVNGTKARSLSSKDPQKPKSIRKITKKISRPRDDLPSADPEEVLSDPDDPKRKAKGRGGSSTRGKSSNRSSLMLRQLTFTEEKAIYGRGGPEDGFSKNSFRTMDDVSGVSILEYLTPTGTKFDASRPIPKATPASSLPSFVSVAPSPSSLIAEGGGGGEGGREWGEGEKPTPGQAERREVSILEYLTTSVPTRSTRATRLAAREDDERGPGTLPNMEVSEPSYPTAAALPSAPSATPIVQNTQRPARPLPPPPDRWAGNS